MSVSLSRIEEEWFRYEPAGQRPLGGRRALAGFNYQLSLSLAAFFDGLFGADPSATHAFEGLSDVAEFRDGLLYVTQVKLTLSTDRIKEAYREFLIVDQFLEERFPDIRAAVRYQVLTKGVRGRVREDLTAADLNLDARGAARWDAIRARLRPMEVRGDPSLDLAIKLWGQVARPLSLVNALRGILVEQLAENSPSETIARALLERLESERIEAVPQGTLLSPSDFADRSAGQTDILIGQRPNPVDLARGCFMDRDDRVAPIVRVVQSALGAGEGPGGRQRKVPVVWIVGGSGAGKSVLLLQTLSRLLTEADVPLHWLGHLVGWLPAALHSWRRQGLAAVIGVDDLFAPEFRGDALWHRIHEAAASPSPVLMLTCGPSDYLDAFERQENRHALLRVHRIEVPPLRADERGRFRAWYEGRTDYTARTEVTATNFVVASFLLERQRKGDADLAEFVARLSERLQAHGVLEEFVAALAANRLGVRAPMHAFEGRRDAMIRFVDEGLCQVQSTPGAEEAVLWFHSALAAAIYEELFPGDAIETRAIHLDRVFATIIDDPDATRNFLEFLGKTKSPRLPEELAREALRKIGRRLVDREPPNLRISALSVWQGASVARNVPVKHILNAERLRSWMSSPALDARGWALLFQLLWDRLAPDQRAPFTTPAMEWLSRHEDFQEWSFVWRLLWKADVFKAELTSLARSWLDSHAMTRGWPFVFQDLFDTGIRAPWLRDAAIRGLTETPFTSADRYLWMKARSLGVADADFLPVLTRRLCRSQIPLLTSEGVRLIGALAASVGSTGVLLALEEGQEEPGWPYVFQEIISIKVLSGEELLPLGLAWLPGREDRAEWNYVFQRLLEFAPDNAALRQIGRSWLVGREDRAAWNYIWQRLREIAPDDLELRNSGCAWLVGREDHPAWAFIWQQAVDLPPHDSALQVRGRNWLTGREARPEWTHVWRMLVDLTPADADLRRIGREWLGGRDERPEWTHVWQMLVDLTPADADLRRIGREWLGGRDERPEWNYVWKRLLDLAPSDRELVDLGREWLIGREDRPEWNYVWQRLWRIMPMDRRLKEQGERWLERHPDHPGAFHVRRALGQPPSA
jgi:hypothetical protein